MSRTVTLAQLRNKIRFQADLIGATIRHPDTGGNGADLTTLVNDSIQGFREEISNDGNTHYLEAHSGTLSAGATSPYSFGSLDISAISPSIVRTYGLDITVDGVVHTLDHRPFTERNIWGGPATTGVPRHWAHYQTAKIAIQPAPNSAYPYTLWYLPVLADLSGDSDTFNGVAGWEEWIVWDVVCRLLIRDQQSQAFATAKTYRDDVWSRIKRQATRVSSAGGAVVGRDSLRGRIPDFLVARGAAMAGGGLPLSGSVTLDMLADMTGPAVIGRISGTGRPTIVGPSGLANYIVPGFTIDSPGLVPAAGGSSTTKFLSQAGTFETVSGGGGGSPGGPSGSIQFAGLSGFVGYTGFAVQGAPPSMTVRLPGTLRVTGGSVEVGSGTVIISASGINVGGGALVSVATLVGFPTFAGAAPGLVPGSNGGLTNFLRGDGQFAAPTGFVSTPTGLLNANLAPMPSGTVKANLSGTAAPADVLIATLLGFSPTFTSSLPGYVPPSGGGTDNFLRADGAFAVPPGTGGSPSGISNAQLAPMQSGTIKMRRSGTGIPEDVTTPTLFSFFPTFSSALPGLVPPSGGGTDNFLRADGSFAIPPGVGSSPSGITNAQLAPMNSGTVKMRRSATGIPEDVVIPTLIAMLPSLTSRFISSIGPLPNPIILGRIDDDGVNLPQPITPTLIATLLPHFSDTGRGMVPASGGGVSNFLRADGNFAAPTGFVSVPTGLPNANLAAMPSGTVKANLSGTAAPSDILIPTLFMHAPTMTATRPGIVGPGGGSLSNFLRGDGAFAAPTGFTFTPTGLPNANLSVMPSGTVKANLSGTGVPADVVIPTLMAFFPTFIAGRVGLVPGTADGDTGKFLNAAGAFSTPVAAAQPGGVSGNLQWNNAGAIDGASGIHAVVGGAALAIGPAALVADSGDLRVASGFALMARNPSGAAQPIVDWWNPTGTVHFGSSGLPRQLFDVASGGAFDFSFGGATATTGRILPTGIDFTAFHAVLKSISVPNINGYPADANQLSRGSVTWLASGIRLYVPKGASTGANRFVVPTGALGTNVTITLWPTGARGGNTIRIERLDRSAGNITVQNPSGTALYIMPSGTAEVADFVFTKPSGAAFEHGGNAGLF